MKILQIIPANHTGKGLHYSSFIRNEVEALEERGHTIIPFYFTARLQLSGFRKSLRELKDLILKEKPQVVHAQFGSITAFLAVRAAGKIPVVVTFGGNDLLGHPNKGFYWRVRESMALALSRWSLARIDHVIVVSKNLYDALPASARKKASIIPRGVNLDIFQTIPMVESRKILGWKGHDKIVIFNQSQKGAQVKNFPLARAAVELLEKEMSCKIHFEVLLNRSREEIVNILNAGDVLLVTSFHEGSPNIVKEAMACNLPVVAVPCGDIEERLKGVSPSFVNPYNAEELAGSLKKVLHLNTRSNGREQLIKQGIDNGSVMERLENIYNNLNDQK